MHGAPPAQLINAYQVGKNSFSKEQEEHIFQQDMLHFLSMLLQTIPVLLYI